MPESLKNLRKTVLYKKILDNAKKLDNSIGKI